MSTVKQYLQGVFQRLGLHQRLRASFLYDIYWGIADNRLIKARRRELVFYNNLLQGLRRDDLILDIGANVGMKTDVFLRLGARVIAVEPDEINQQILKEKFLRLRLKRKPVVVVGKAVSDEIATETMWVDGPGSALNTLSQKWAEALRTDKTRFSHTQDSCDFAQRRIVETTTLDQLIAAYGLPFFVKIDVEGYEVRALRGLKRSVPFLSFEINLPEFKSEGLECINLLGRLAAEGKFNYAVDCQRGLALDEWLDVRTFRSVLEHCSEKAIEVFWKTVSSKESN
jgi:FkbM family methyltransferase